MRNYSVECSKVCGDRLQGFIMEEGGKVRWDICGFFAIKEEGEDAKLRHIDGVEAWTLVDINDYIQEH
eukprot:11221134-Lingulodinium_polyedra.AAC.1